MTKEEQKGAEAAGQALAAKRAEAEKKAAEEKARFEELINTPLTEEEARKAFADLDVNRAQMLVIRQKCVARIDAANSEAAQYKTQLDGIDEKLAEIDLERAVVFRRTLNKAKDAE